MKDQLMANVKGYCNEFDLDNMLVNANMYRQLNRHQHVRQHKTNVLDDR